MTVWSFCVRPGRYTVHGSFNVCSCHHLSLVGVIFTGLRTSSDVSGFSSSGIGVGVARAKPIAKTVSSSNSTLKALLCCRRIILHFTSAGRNIGWKLLRVCAHMQNEGLALQRMQNPTPICGVHTKGVIQYLCLSWKYKS